MARTQKILGLGTVSLTDAGVLYPAYNSKLFVKSWTIQAGVENTGIVTVCDIAGNPLVELAPNLAVTWLGDNMDNGTAAKSDLNTIQVKSSSGGDTAIVSISEGL